MELFKEKILVVGLGRSGLSVARWLARERAEVTVSEIRAKSELSPGMIREMSELGIKLETGGHKKDTFLKAEMIIASPGVPLDIEPLKEAKKRGIPIIGEMELACRLIDIPVVAVTGTNGKSTTTALIGFMIKNAGLKVFVGGNIGTPLMDYAAGDWKADYAVVEVSSFQLDTSDRFCPMVSLLLNISPDHLDRYSSYDAYVQSKLKIFRNQGSGHYAILNDDDEKLSRFEPAAGVSVLRYGLEKRGSRHAFMDGRNIRACLPGVKACCFDIDKFRLPGRHNLENLMAGVLAGLALHVESHVIQKTVDHFKGLPHRLELVSSIRDVDFYNDSKATNVDATSRSITSFDRPVILIAGGLQKGGDYSSLVRAAEGRVREAIFIGESKHFLAKLFKGIIPFTLAEDMQDAVTQAFSSSKSNDVVLLSPACSSFDMFSDYAHRGMIFKEAVERLDNGS